MVTQLQGSIIGRHDRKRSIEAVQLISHTVHIYKSYGDVLYFDPFVLCNQLVGLLWSYRACLFGVCIQWFSYDIHVQDLYCSIEKERKLD